jgi:hypothetical protein
MSLGLGKLQQLGIGQDFRKRRDAQGLFLGGARQFQFRHARRDGIALGMVQDAAGITG